MARPRKSHERVSSWLREQIESGIYAVDDLLPSEHDLCHRFDVSRITARRALRTLQDEGLIVRRHGVGSLVADLKAQGGLIAVDGLREDLSENGLDLSGEVLREEDVRPPDDIAARLALGNDTTSRFIERLWADEAGPVALEHVWLTKMVAQLLRPADIGRNRILPVLADRYDMPVSRAEFTVRAVNAPNDIAGRLGVPWGRALQRIDTVMFAGSEIPFCVRRRTVRSDRVQLRIRAAAAGSDRLAPAGFLPVETVRSVIPPTSAP